MAIMPPVLAPKIKSKSPDRQTSFHYFLHSAASLHCDSGLFVIPLKYDDSKGGAVCVKKRQDKGEQPSDY
jgi:hypothetical protein